MLLQRPSVPCNAMRQILFFALGAIATFVCSMHCGKQWQFPTWRSNRKTLLDSGLQLGSTARQDKNNCTRSAAGIRDPFELYPDAFHCETGQEHLHEVCIQIDLLDCKQWREPTGPPTQKSCLGSRVNPRCLLNRLPTHHQSLVQWVAETIDKQKHNCFAPVSGN